MEFDSCINLLSFSIDIKIADELAQLKSDQDDLFKYILGMEDGTIKKIGDDVSYVKDDTEEIKACLANLKPLRLFTVILGLRIY
ncbi:unnamed protein product [Rhizophagus irregularis]|nr:unnamed protein product [Rhizophagus irregularis]